MLDGLGKAKAQGHRLVILVGDEPYYARVGFKRVPHGQIELPGPVDPDRLLYLELAEDALMLAKGLVLPPYRFAELMERLPPKLPDFGDKQAPQNIRL